MKLVPAVILAATLAVAGCNAGSDASDDPASDTEALAARTPIPFGLQFVGTYEDAGAPTGQVRSVTLDRHGRYAALFAGSRHVERGVYFAPSHPGLPMVLRLITTGHSWTATVSAYDGALQVARGGVASRLTATTPVGPNESVCDDSGGSWADDDADPTTGLLCVCPASTVYIPSAGGCTR